MDFFGRRARRDNAALLKLVEAASVIYAEKARKIQALNLEIAELRGQLQVLRQPMVESTSPVPVIASQPLYLNEQEEDIEYAFKNDLIDKATYEDMLAQLQFDNTEITFDYS